MKPRDTDLMIADYAEAFPGKRYDFKGVVDGAAMAALLKLAPIEEIRERWKFGLHAQGWCGVSSIAQLRGKWNDIQRAMAELEGTATKPAPIVPEQTFDCGECGDTIDMGAKGRCWSSGLKRWLCGKCFDTYVLKGWDVEAETAKFKSNASP
jgi:hypothetical protein